MILWFTAGETNRAELSTSITRKEKADPTVSSVSCAAEALSADPPPTQAGAIPSPRHISPSPMDHVVFGPSKRFCQIDDERIIGIRVARKMNANRKREARG